MTSAFHSYRTAKELADDIERNGLSNDPLYPKEERALIVAALRSHGPNGKAWEKVWISQDVIMHLQGIEAQAGKLSDAINLFKRFESEARTDATSHPTTKE